MNAKKIFKIFVYFVAMGILFGTLSINEIYLTFSFIKIGGITIAIDYLQIINGFLIILIGGVIFNYEIEDSF